MPNRPPKGYTNCDDGLACTDDVCLGLGHCDFPPKQGMCALPVAISGATVVKCFMPGEANPADPCRVCDPTANPEQWTPLAGCGP